MLPTLNIQLLNLDCATKTPINSTSGKQTRSYEHFCLSVTG